MAGMMRGTVGWVLMAVLCAAVVCAKAVNLFPTHEQNAVRLGVRYDSATGQFSHHPISASSPSSSFTSHGVLVPGTLP